MAGGFTKDGAVQDQIDASVKDEINRARSKLSTGASRSICESCSAKIPLARQHAIPGVKLCISCQEEVDQTEVGFHLVNRRANKDSQLR